MACLLVISSSAPDNAASSEVLYVYTYITNIQICILVSPRQGFQQRQKYLFHSLPFQMGKQLS
eukprot:34751_1